MTPAAIRAAEGPALDAFVAEHVLGWMRDPSSGEWIPGGDAHLLMNTVEAPDPYSTDNAACWRWVVPALRKRGWTVGVESSLIDPSVWYGTLGHMRHDTVLVEAPTPALAIVRAAALTVAEGGE